jgi:hypothetical protein
MSAHNVTHVVSPVSNENTFNCLLYYKTDAVCLSSQSENLMASAVILTPSLTTETLSPNLVAQVCSEKAGAIKQSICIEKPHPPFTRDNVPSGSLLAINSVSRIVKQNIPQMI